MADSAYEELYAIPEIYVEGIPESFINQLSPLEVILGESLLTPGLQTMVRIECLTSNYVKRNYDDLKNKQLVMKVQRKVLAKFGINDTFKLRQTIYRCADRKMTSPNTEEFVMYACDQTLLEDAKSLVSKSWKCTTPNVVVSDVLQACTGAKLMHIEDCAPARDYVAENIHPFQVVAQQCNVALAAGDDPSFVHYMTFGAGTRGDEGKHHFRSLKQLTEQSPYNKNFYYAEVPERYPHPQNILFHTFPCDFDLLSDLLNGVDETGKDLNSATLYNAFKGNASLFGNQTLGCGIGGANIRAGMTSKGSENVTEGCPDFSYLYLPKRQARMALLEQDKIALRFTVPWNPELHAGMVVSVWFRNTTIDEREEWNYGTGEYLISALTHKIKRGGQAFTTMDCVSTTVGRGVQ